MRGFSRARSRASIRRESIIFPKMNEMAEVVKNAPVKNSTAVPFDLENFKNFAIRNLQRDLSVQSVFTRAPTSHELGSEVDVFGEIMRWSSTSKNATVNQKSAEKLLISVLKKISKDLNDDSTSALAIMGEIRTLKHIRGNEVAIQFATDMLKHRDWKVRLEAMQMLPDLVFKGDSRAIADACSRLHDWNADVRRAAILSLRDTPGILTLKIIQAKDLSVQGKYPRVACDIKIILPSESHAMGSNCFSTSKALFSRERVHWNDTAKFVIADLSEANCMFQVQQENDEGLGPILLGSCKISLDLFEDEEPQAQEWIRLSKDEHSTNSCGSILIQGIYTQGPGMAEKGRINKTLTHVVSCLFDENLLVRREATLVLSQHIRPGNLDFTRLLAELLLGPNCLLRWTAVAALKVQLNTLDRNCCQMVAQASVRCLKSENDDNRACGIEMMQTAIFGLEEDWKSADGKSLKDIITETSRDKFWLVRRGALKLLRSLARGGDELALQSVLPFLEDASFYVRCAACEVISVVSERTFHLEGDPSDKDIELAYKITQATSSVASGIKFNLLFEMGVCDPHRADWSAKQHAEWAYIRQWVEAAVAKMNEQHAAIAYFSNNLIRRARSSMSYNQAESSMPTGESEIDHEQALLNAAIEMAKEEAACSLQCSWRRKLARRTLFQQQVLRQDRRSGPSTIFCEEMKAQPPDRSIKKYLSAPLAPEEFPEIKLPQQKPLIVYEKEVFSKSGLHYNSPFKNAISHGVPDVTLPSTFIRRKEHSTSSRASRRSTKISKVDYALSCKFPEIYSKLSKCDLATSVPLDQTRVILLRNRIRKIII